MMPAGFSTSPCLSRWTMVVSDIAQPAYLVQVRHGSGYADARPQLAPSCHEAIRHVLRGERVTQVIPPRPVDVHQTSPQTFLVKSQLLHDPPARMVVRLDARFQPVQAYHAETMVRCHS